MKQIPAIAPQVASLSVKWLTHTREVAYTHGGSGSGALLKLLRRRGKERRASAADAGKRCGDWK